MTDTPNLALPLLSEGQAGAHVTHNDALMQIDAKLGTGHGPAGGFVRAGVREVTLDLAGASVTELGIVPTRCIVLGVTTRVLDAVTGAASFDCGTAVGASEFGGTLGVTAGSENVGVIGPVATYAPGDVVLTANGGNFTGGRVLVVVHLLEMGVA